MLLLHAAAQPPLWSAWISDPAPAVAVAALAASYAFGVRRAWAKAGRARAVSRGQAASFALAVLILVVALVSPLDALADELFVAHMAQHVLLSVIVPPLFVFGAPEVAALWAMPRRARQHIGRTISSNRAMRATWRAVTRPMVAWLLHAVAIWLWHAPRLYALALRSDVAHALEHLSFVGTGTLLWWSIVHPRGERRTAYAVGIVTIFATAMHTGVLGALFTLSRRVLYPAQAAGAAHWGLTPLQDQQLAGLVMWVPGGLLYVAAMGVLFVGWLEPRGKRRAVGALLVSGAAAAAGCGRAEASSVPGGSVQRGKAAIEAAGCGACHTVDGVPNAHGEVGPPLTGIARRSMIAGELPNTPMNMIRWIEDPQAIEPNTAMPTLGLTPQSVRDVVAYLYTLR